MKSESEPTEREICGSDYSLHRLIAVLLRDQLELPVWICFADSRLRINEENKEGVIQGLMIAADIAALEYDN